MVITDTREPSRLKRWEYFVLYAALIVVFILYAVVVIMGAKTEWYSNLKQANVNPWLIRGLWLFATAMYYVTFYLLREDLKSVDVPKDLKITPLFLVSSLLFLSWCVALYYSENLIVASWASALLFLYNLWLFIYIWDTSPFAALFAIPTIVLYGYLFYSTLHLESINDESS